MSRKEQHYEAFISDLDQQNQELQDELERCSQQIKLLSEQLTETLDQNDSLTQQVIYISTLVPEQADEISYS